MKEKEKKEYENNLIKYSLIIRDQKASKEEIMKCIKVFEYFEEYEKCKDLLEILSKPGNKK
jgi:hypothetical protein